MTEELLLRFAPQYGVALIFIVAWWYERRRAADISKEYIATLKELWLRPSQQQHGWQTTTQSFPTPPPGAGGDD